MPSFLSFPWESAPAPTADCSLIAFEAEQNPAVGGVGEVEVPIAHGDVVGQGVRTARKRQDAEQRLPAGEDLAAVHLFEQRGDLRAGQRRCDGYVDFRVQRAEQRRGDPGGVELPGHAAPEHGNTGVVLREVLVGASRQSEASASRDMTTRSPVRAMPSTVASHC